MKQKNGNDLILVSAIIFASIAAILLATAVGDEVAEWIGGLFLMLFGLPFVTIAGVCLIAGLVRKARSKRMSPRSIA